MQDFALSKGPAQDADAAALASCEQPGRDTFTVCLPVLIRPCRAGDLPALEWFGLFAAHRALVRKTFRRQQRGEALMLVAEVGGEASGQLWIDWRGHGPGVAEIWAVRVMPCLQGQQIGARLVAAAEKLLLARGCRRAVLEVETDNPRARRFYERHGYRLRAIHAAAHRPEAGMTGKRTVWLMQKDLQ
jgi:ribosomal protein S18 acetylase RimI-like enzyme